MLGYLSDPLVGHVGLVKEYFAEVFSVWEHLRLTRQVRSARVN